MAGGRGADRAASSPLFGREDVLEEVDRALELATQGSGQGLLLSGLAGSGKTHVLRAVTERAAGRGYLTLAGRALPEELPPPFSLVRRLVVSQSDVADRPPSDERAPGTLPIFLAPLGEERERPAEPGVSGTQASAAQEELDRILAPFGRSGIEGLGAGREVLLERVVDYFRSLAHDRPLLIAVDDLELADPSSLEFLERFARELPSVSAMVVATLDGGSVAPESTRPALETLARSPSFRTVAVRSLTVPETTEFVRWVLGGRAPDPQDVLRWHAQTEGNPLFLEQLVRTSTGLGPASRNPPEGGRTVTEVLVARVRTLPENDRRILTYAAVLGKEFTFADLAAVAGLDEERVTEGLDHLVQRGLLREKGREVYEFVSEAVRTSVYADLTETRRRILHLKAGQALEAHGRDRESELARQFYLGRDNDRAVKYNVEAAETAIRAFAFETAVAHLARALEAERRRVERDPKTEMRLLTDEGRILSEMGNYRQSEEVLEDAVRLARAKAGYELELGRALLGLADARANRGEYASAEGLATEAWALLTKVGTRRDLMAAHRVLGVVHWRRGDLAQAETHHRAALEVARSEGTPSELGHAMVDVAITISPRGPTRIEPALELLSNAAELFGKVEDYGARARVLMDRAVLEHEAERSAEALRDIGLAIEAAERSRSPIWIGYCHLNLAQWEAARGRADLARPALARAVQVLATSGDRLGDQQIELTRGMIAHAERAYDAAEASYQEALNQARAIRLGTDALEAWVRLAVLAHDRGDEETARERVREIRSSGQLSQRPDLATLINELENTLAAPLPQTR
jgi:tetratricopeptide (TPR) repeat protein